jgi:molybdate transport system substrate-binding protein
MALTIGGPALAADVKVLSAGAMRGVILAVLPEFEKETGHKVAVDGDTAGGLVRRISGGEMVDVVVIPRPGLDQLAASGKIAGGTRINLARVGVGVVVKAGAPKPDVGTVESFKRVLLDAKSIAYMDPASGASSGIYVASLIDRLGLAAALQPKTKLIRGSSVALSVAHGEAELGLHQISEILGVAGAELVGPLPREIQNFTVYAAAVGTKPQSAAAALAFVTFLVGPSTAAAIKARGMERP